MENSTSTNGVVAIDYPPYCMSHHLKINSKLIIDKNRSVETMKI
jgi:hypothetical protein